MGGGGLSIPGESTVDDEPLRRFAWQALVAGLRASSSDSQSEPHRFVVEAKRIEREAVEAAAKTRLPRGSVQRRARR
jgi:hypothetical protein